MGFINDLIGGTNKFDAQAINNPFAAQQANAGNFDFSSALGQAQKNALGGQGAANATGAQQTALANALAAQASGQGPSLAQMQLQQATEANKAGAAGAIASQRGLNPALAARQIANQQANIGQQAAGQSAMTRLQEQLGAQGMLAQTLGAQRGQDIGQQKENTGLYGAIGGLQQGQRGQDIGNFQAAQGLNAQTAAQNAGFKSDAQRMNAQIASDNAQRNSGLLGGLLGSAGAAASSYLGKASGGEINGRAPVPGDSPRNDNVPAWLSPGEIVIPRSIVGSPNAPEQAADFVRAIQQHHQGTNFGHVIARHQELDDRVRRLEAVAQKFDVGGVVNSVLPQELLGQSEGNTPSYQSGVSAPASTNPITGERDWDVSVGQSPAQLATANRREAGPVEQPPIMAQEQTPSTNAASQPAPAEPQKPKPELGMTDPGGINKFSNEAKGAAKQSANVTQQEANVQERIQNDYTEQAKAYAVETQKGVQERQARADTQKKLVESGKIDPNHLWSSSSTASKISAGIGILLGGIGQGLIGGPNQALQVIDKAIDRDIDSQKANLGKQEGLLHTYLQEGHDYQTARQLAKADLLDNASSQLKAAAMKYSGPKAQAAAMGQVAAIDQQAFQMRQQAGAQNLEAKLKNLQIQAFGEQEQLRRGKMAIEVGAASGKPLTAQQVSILGKEKEYVDVGGGKFYKAQGDEAAKEYREKSSQLQRGIDILNEMTTGHWAPEWTPGEGGDAAIKAKAQTHELVDLLANYRTSNRFASEKARHFEEIVPHAASFRSGKADIQHTQLLGQLIKEKEDMKRNLLLGTSKSQGGGQQ